MKRALIALALLVAVPAAAQSPRYALVWAAPATGPLPGTAAEALPDGTATDQAIRIPLTLDTLGPRIRLRLSNRFGAKPLELDEVSLALSNGGAALVARSARPVFVKNSRHISIPPGESIWSDPLAPPPGGRALTISLRVTGLSPALAASAGQAYATPPGGHAIDDFETAFTASLPVVPVLSAIEVQAIPTLQSLLILGDTPAAATTDGWPAILTRRLHDATPDALAIGTLRAPGARLAALADAIDDELLPPSVTAVLISAGGADIAQARPRPEAAADALAALARHIRAKVPGVRIVATTLPPLPRGSLTPEQDRARAQFNQFIRLTDLVDEVADLDSAVAAPDGALRMTLAPGKSEQQNAPGRAGQISLAGAVSPYSLLRKPVVKATAPTTDAASAGPNAQ